MIIERESLANKDVEILHVFNIVKLGESGIFLKEVVDKLRTHNVIIDFLGVDTVDSTGIGELVAYCIRIADNGKRFAFLNAPQRVAQLLKIVNLSHIPNFADKEQAIASFSRISEVHASPI